MKLLTSRRSLTDDMDHARLQYLFTLVQRGTKDAGECSCQKQRLFSSKKEMVEEALRKRWANKC